MKRSVLFLTGFFLTLLTYAQEIQPTVYEGIGITGDAADVTVPTELAIVLMGGSTDVDQALQWMIERAQGGDVIILRASGSTGYNEYIYGLGKVNSVETLLIDSREKAMKEAVGKRIREAEMVFIAGGDQWNYVKYWKDSEVSKAIKYLVDEKKIPIGGTSAGCAVLSGYIFDARHGSAYSKDVMLNPYDTTVSVSKSFIQVPFLENTISDQHYSQRERPGRHLTFMARMIKDFNVQQPKGIGVDEKTAVCIDKNGNAVVFGTNNAQFLFSNSKPEQCVQGKALHWNRNRKAINVIRIRGTEQGSPLTFTLTKWPAYDTLETWFVDNGKFGYTIED